MLRLLNIVIENDLSPNGLYVLLCLLHKQKPVNVNLNLELIKLNSLGLTLNGDLTKEGFDKAVELSNLNDFIKKINKNKTYKLTDEDILKIKEYREIFPKGLLPSGQPARVQIKELEKKFTWFLNNYEYNWETIIKATKKYVNQYESDNYKYMKTSGYFVSKLEKNEIISTLASYCDMIVDGGEDETTKYITHNTL